MTWESFEIRKVPYCPHCGLPPEYCVFSTKYDKCKEWLAVNFPEILGLETSDKSLSKRKEKSEKPDQKKAKKIKIERKQRQRNKFVVHIFGLAKALKLDETEMKKTIKEMSSTLSVGVGMDKKIDDMVKVQTGETKEVVEFIKARWTLEDDAFDDTGN